MGGTDSQGIRLPGHGGVWLAAARVLAGIVPTPLVVTILERRVMYGSELDPNGRKGNGSGLNKGNKGRTVPRNDIETRRPSVTVCHREVAQLLPRQKESCDMTGGAFLFLFLAAWRVFGNGRWDRAAFFCLGIVS